MKLINKKIFQSCIAIIVTLIITTGITYAWITNDISISKSIVIQNGVVNEINIDLYRGYDYDLNGTLDVKNSNADNELDMYYINITNIDNDEVLAIMEASVISYRVVFDNTSESIISVNPYFYFNNAILENNLINKYMSLLFNLNEVTIINNVGLENESEVTEIINKSLCLYADSQIIKKNVIINPNTKTYLDLKIKAANLREMNDGLSNYFAYSQNANYDLSKGIYSDILKTPLLSLTNGNEVINLVDGKVNRYVSLEQYYNDDYNDIYTYDYLELLKVYSQKQDLSSQSVTSLSLTINKFCFDLKYITGDDSTSILSVYNSIDLSLYHYLNEEEINNNFYNNNNVLTLINSLYDLSDGIYDENGNKIYTIYDLVYKYTLIYEENIVVKIIKEVI